MLLKLLLIFVSKFISSVFINNETITIMTNRLQRSLTVLELIQLQRMFSVNRGYKDLIRDFKHDFNVILDKSTAKQFIKNRSWSEVLYWLTGEKIITDDEHDKINTVDNERKKKYELLEQMIKINNEDKINQQNELDEFNKDNYYIPEGVKYFNFPLYGEIITYKFKEPYLKCFLLNQQGDKRKINKIEDVPITEELPLFLLSILRKINSSRLMTTKTTAERLADNMNTQYYVNEQEAEELGLKNIFESKLFKNYHLTYKC